MPFNRKSTKNPRPSQAPEVRRHNFQEVAIGYTQEMAIDEAKRCRQCKNPGCVPLCPVHIDIPGFIAEVAKGDFEKAYEVISRSSSLPAVCGRVCPQESQCEKECLRHKRPVREGGKVVRENGKPKRGESVGIGRLERFVADYHREHAKPVALDIKKNGHKVAVIGSGPSGLACAYDLAKAGYEVTIFEALHVAGGVLRYGIPEFRLPKAIVQNEIEGLKRRGVEIKTDRVIGRVLSIDELRKEYHFEAVFVGTGAGLPRFLGIPGENAKGVYSANEYLTRVNLRKAYQEDSKTPIEHAKHVVVVGGGNVARDALRTPLRLGAETSTCVYRRSMAELPARKEEIEHAEQEGVVFDLLRNPIEIIYDTNGSPSRRAPDYNPNYGCVTGIKVQKQKLGEPDASGRRRPVPVTVEEDPEAIYTIPCDCVIIAIGTSPNPLIKATTPGIETNPHGCLIVHEETNETTKDGVFAGGDAVTGAATVILAMGAGRKAAKAIMDYLAK